MLKFEFLEKSLGIVSPPSFVYDFLQENVCQVILC